MSEQTRVSHPIYNLLPTEIEGFNSLAELSLDMRWSWNHATDDVWQRLDPRGRGVGLFARPFVQGGVRQSRFLRRVRRRRWRGPARIPGLEVEHTQMRTHGLLDTVKGSWLPANFIQAQRDSFGAHTYDRVDAEGVFHTEWEAE